MKISDVEKSTGLTAKAIRLYEEKGLISVERKNNRYRDYSADTVNNHQTVITESNALLGIDIGTTNISAVIIDIERNTVLETYTITNNSKLNTDSDLSECDAEWIVNKVKRITDYIIKAFPNIKSIGITGQMHGIVYVDESGKAVSPLYTWQDGRGNRKFDKDTTYCQEIFKRTNYTVFSGYGFSTLFYNTLHDIQPETAKTFCSIMDYVIMVLAGNLTPFIHTTNAASFGLYDIQKKSFDTNAVKKLGLSHLSLPYIIEDGKPIGFYQNIPVSVGIGDNQASFYGTVKKDDTSVLVNFGTGSQISVVSDAMQSIDDLLEIRPYLFGKYLL